VERLLRLPHTRFCYRPPEYMPEVSPLPAAKTGRVSFGCLTNLSKVNEAVLALWGEVLRGRSDPHVRDRYDRAFSLTRMLHLSSAGWRRVARLAWELDRRGEVIPLTDIIIGVTALEHHACVLTFDRHYQKIPGLIALSDLE
jgi:hypothetical protein